MTDHFRDSIPEQVDHDKMMEYLIAENREWNSIIYVAVDCFPSDRGPGWNAGVYILSYHEPSSVIPEPLRKRGIADDEVMIATVHHGPGTPTDLLTMAYLEAIKYLDHTLEMISRFTDDGRVPFRTVKCTSRSKPWLAQFLNIDGKDGSINPISDKIALPMSLIARMMVELMDIYDLTFTFDLNPEDGYDCGLIDLCKDVFESERNRYDG